MSDMDSIHWRSTDGTLAADEAEQRLFNLPVVDRALADSPPAEEETSALLDEVVSVDDAITTDPLEDETRDDRSRFWKRVGATVAGSALVLGGGFAVIKSLGGSENSPTNPAAATSPNKAGGSGLESLTAKNICDVVTEDEILSMLKVSNTNITARQCYSSLSQGLVTAVDWRTDSGVYLGISVFDDTQVGRTSSRDRAGNLNGFGDFNDYTSLEATEYFTLSGPTGKTEYKGAANDHSLRVKVGNYFIEIRDGVTASDVPDGATLGTAPNIAGPNRLIFQNFAQALVNETFIYNK